MFLARYVQGFAFSCSMNASSQILNIGRLLTFAGKTMCGRQTCHEFLLRGAQSPHKNVAKLIVATSTDQIPVLEKIAGLGKADGVKDLYMISGEEARQLEPALLCIRALVSPSTGIVDSHAFMVALQVRQNIGLATSHSSTV